MRHLQKSLPGGGDSLNTLFGGSNNKTHFCEASFFKEQVKNHIEVKKVVTISTTNHQEPQNIKK
jgi:hypothetical protein